MRFMMLMMPKGYETAAAGTMPPPDKVAAMMAYNNDFHGSVGSRPGCSHRFRRLRRLRRFKSVRGGA